MTTRERLVAFTALTLQRKGYYGTGIREILVGTSVPKGSLYHHFPTGKEGLVGESLAYYGQQLLTAYKSCLKKKSAAKGLRAIISMRTNQLIASNFLEADPLALCAMELGESHPPLVRICRDQYDQAISLIQKFLTKRKISAPDTRANRFFMALKGAELLAQMQRSTDPMDLLSDQIRLLLKD